MILELSQAGGHGKQGRTTTRSQEAQEESSAEGESAGDLCGEQADHRETLVGGSVRLDCFSRDVMARRHAGWGPPWPPLRGCSMRPPTIGLHVSEKQSSF